jgi:hypothetical protein
MSYTRPTSIISGLPVSSGKWTGCFKEEEKNHYQKDEYTDCTGLPKVRALER